MQTNEWTDKQIIALLDGLSADRRKNIAEHLYPENGEWIMESVPGDERMDAETFAAVQEGIADVLAGRSYTLEEVREYVLGALARNATFQK